MAPRRRSPHSRCCVDDSVRPKILSHQDYCLFLTKGDVAMIKKVRCASKGTIVPWPDDLDFSSAATSRVITCRLKPPRVQRIRGRREAFRLQCLLIVSANPRSSSIRSNL